MRLARRWLYRGQSPLILRRSAMLAREIIECAESRDELLGNVHGAYAFGPRAQENCDQFPRFQLFLPARLKAFPWPFRVRHFLDQQSAGHGAGFLIFVI